MPARSTVATMCHPMFSTMNRFPDLRPGEPTPAQPFLHVVEDPAKPKRAVS